MQTIAKLAFAAGACALGLGAVAPVHAADMGYPEAQAAPGYPAPPPVEYDTYVAPPYVVAPGAVSRAVLARLRASLCLWLWPLARLSALVKSAIGALAITHPSCPRLSRGSTSYLDVKQKTWMAGTSPAMTREEHLRIFICESLRVPVRLSWIARTQGMFHSKCFTPNKLDFRGLENRMKKFVDRA